MCRVQNELEGFGIRLNKSPPNLTFKRKERGGVNLTSTVRPFPLLYRLREAKTDFSCRVVLRVVPHTHTQCPLTNLDADICKAVLSEYRIHNADVSLRYDATVDDLIDVIEGNRVYIPCLYALNKIDQLTLEELDVIDKIPHYVPISAHLEWNLDGLLEKTWEYLDLTRMYAPRTQHDTRHDTH